MNALWGMALTGIVASWTACGGGDDPPSTDLQTEAEAMAECQRHCEAEDGRCEAPDGEHLAFCIDECQDDATWIREDAARARLACIEKLACDFDPDIDDCLDIVEPLDVHLDYEQICREAVLACDGQDDLGRDFPPCLCDVDGDNLVSWVAPAAMPPVIECLSQPCGDILSCLELSLPHDGVEVVFGCASN